MNGIRAVEKRGFTEWIEKENADIVCLNETKAEPGQLSPQLKNPMVKGKPYFSYWASAKKKGYSGVAIYSKKEPDDVHFLGKPEFDDEGRILVAEYRQPSVSFDFTLITAYFPNSQDERKRLPYKLAFNDAILKLCNSIVKKGKHFLLCGDYNVAHTPIDIARPKSNENSAGYLPEEREWMDKFIAAGNVDTFRHFNPGKTGCYTWWSYMGQARRNNVGWRIDYHCVDKGFLSKVKSSIIRAEVEGSDHCPVEIELAI
uniref:Exodeoxyribonuclease III n=1 Tax=uncultured bacterium contig00064 TaxID=1181547 RepID=A0A806KLK6_9BACT|nr:exodeoxyribonuclease III [uncultured bacterium contig00064]